MAVLGWVMIGLALWHFTIFIDDHFWGGIVGAFVGAVFGAVIFAFAINGLAVPSRDDTEILTVLQGAPGTVLGLFVVYLEGLRRERAEAPV